jgi:hypothetical protein
MVRYDFRRSQWACEKGYREELAVLELSRKSRVRGWLVCLGVPGNLSLCEVGQAEGCKQCTCASMEDSNHSREKASA